MMIIIGNGIYIDHATYIEIVHCENLGEPVREAAKAFDVPLSTARAVYAEHRKDRRAA